MAGTTRTVRVLAVDDQPLFLEAARALVSHTAGFELVGESRDGASAIDLARDLDPDLVIVDVRMKGMDGIDTARHLNAQDPTRVIVLATSSDISALSEAAEHCGVAAVVRKQWLNPRLLRGIWAAHRRR
jgi:DNA-binding NarL/FixJ family response regulator